MTTTPTPEPATYTGIYAMHKYWSRKPHNIVRDYILKYSSAGDLVVDPFCGSGVSIIEAVHSGRKGLGIDINPSAIRIAQHALENFDLQQIEHEFAALQDKCQETIDNGYRIARDGRSFVASHLIWLKGRISEVWYNAPDRKGKRVVDSATDGDLQHALTYSYRSIPYFFPQNELIYNTRINISRGQNVRDLFTPRNLYALALLWHHIQQIEDLKIRQFFSVVFTSCLGQASKMVFVIRRRGKHNGKNRGSGLRKEVGSWVIGYWIPEEHFELNVWDCFAARYFKTLKAKKQQAQQHATLPAHYFPSLDGIFLPNSSVSGYHFINSSAIDALSSMPDDSIDYVVTDPPHGNRIPYLELSMLWNSWFPLEIDYTKEMIISDAKARQKTKADYYSLFQRTVGLIEQKLKWEKYFSLMFNSLDDDTWQQIFQIVYAHKFRLVDVGILGYSANSVIQDCRKNGLKTDFVFTFQKSIAATQVSLKRLPPSQVDAFLSNVLDEIMAQYGDQFKPYLFINRVIQEQIAQGYLIPISVVIDRLKAKTPLSE